MAPKGQFLPEGRTHSPEYQGGHGKVVIAPPPLESHGFPAGKVTEKEHDYAECIFGPGFFLERCCRHGISVRHRKRARPVKMWHAARTRRKGEKEPPAVRRRHRWAFYPSLTSRKPRLWGTLKKFQSTILSSSFSTSRSGYPCLSERGLQKQ